LVSWGDITRKNEKVLQLTLKNGKKVKLTSDHKVFTDKGWMEAGELKNHPNIKILSFK
jgi:intein/homing endonuclease